MNANAAGKPLGILVALDEELRAILPHVESARKRRIDGVLYHEASISGHRVILLRSGMGARRAREACFFLIQKLDPLAIIATGFAGGIDPRLQTGDLVIADPLYDPPRPAGDGPRKLPPHPDLLAAAELALEGEARLFRGTLLTTKTIVATAAAKADVFAEHAALAVDMESLGVARAANVHDTPLLCLRAIIDDAECDLPLDFSRVLTAAGRPRFLRLAGAILRRPSVLGGLARMAGRARRAGDTLGSAIQKLVPAIAARPPQKLTEEV